MAFRFQPVRFSILRMNFQISILYLLIQGHLDSLLDASLEQCIFDG